MYLEESINQRTDSTMAKRKRTKGQTTIYDLQEWISRSNIAWKMKTEMWDAIRSPFRHNISMIAYLSKWHEWREFIVVILC